MLWDDTIKRASAKYIPGNKIWAAKTVRIWYGIFSLFFAIIEVVAITAILSQNSIPDRAEVGVIVFGCIVWLFFTYRFMHVMYTSIHVESDRFIYRRFLRKAHNISFGVVTQYGIEVFFGRPMAVIHITEKQYRIIFSQLVGFRYLWETLRKKVGADKEQNQVAITLEGIADYEKAYMFSYNHREKLLADERCGCFRCVNIFNPSEIKEWDRDSPTTAICPYCGNIAVIGESSGFPITEEFLLNMHDHFEFHPTRSKRKVIQRTRNNNRND